jgi:hypothetical protein
MSGPKDTKKWQKRYINVLENALSTPDFQERIEILRGADNEQAQDLYLKLYSDYKLPAALWDCLRRYILTNKIDRTYIRPDVAIISDYDEVLFPSDHPDVSYKIYQQSQLVGKKSEVKLVFDVYASKDEVDQLLTEYWPKITELAQSAAATERKRLRKRPMEERDQYIISLNKKGMKPKEIEDYLKKDDSFPDALTAADIRQILDRKS